MGNILYYGDNLEILREPDYFKDKSVDLVYLDPPFNSNQNYNVLFKEKDGTKAASQIRAFEDTWTWSSDDEELYADLVTQGDKVADCLKAFRTFLGPCDMLAYLVMMAPRLVELRRVMKPTASIYLHCDPAASHYLKMMLDGIFGPANFMGEVIWRRTSSHVSSRRWPRLHDVILNYAANIDEVFFDPPRVEADEGWVKREYRHKDERGVYMVDNLTGAGTTEGPSGQPWRGVDPKTIGAGRHWRYSPETLDKLDADGRIYWPARGKFPKLKQYLHESGGKAVGDVWNDIQVIGRTAAERLGYPTQKPEALLERIISASSREGDLVLDPFCGCGTTIAAAQKLNRKWVGIDVTYPAIALVKNRLADAFGDQADYQVVGEPASLPDAQELAESDPYQFQWWALDLVGARPVEKKKGADKGIDGRIVFQVDNRGNFDQVLISVKSGNLQASYVRDLRGVVEREKAAIGVLISMENPSKPMRTEAVVAGFFESKTWGKKYPKIQLLTVADLLAGKKIEMPPIKQVDATFKRAERHRPGEGTQLEIKEPDPD